MVHTVRNMRTGETRMYGPITAKEAVIVAYAQERGDYNTWDYWDRYAAKIEEGKWHYFAGDWGVRK